jgi:hypothetical protein
MKESIRQQIDIKDIKLNVDSYELVSDHTEYIIIISVTVNNLQHTYKLKLRYKNIRIIFNNINSSYNNFDLMKDFPTKL